MVVRKTLQTPAFNYSLRWKIAILTWGFGHLNFRVATAISYNRQMACLINLISSRSAAFEKKIQFIRTSRKIFALLC